MNVDKAQSYASQVFVGDEVKELGFGRGLCNGERSQQAPEPSPIARIADGQLAGDERMMEHLTKGNQRFESVDTHSEVVDPDRGVDDNQ